MAGDAVHALRRGGLAVGSPVLGPWLRIGSGEFASYSREERETTVLCQHLLQNSMAYIKSIMLRQVLSEDAWRTRMRSEDWRTLTLLIYGHVYPYGRFDLDLQERLVIGFLLAA